MYPIQIKFIFIGLILGSVPSLINEVKSNYKLKFSYLFFTIVTLIFALFLVFLEKKISSESNILEYNSIYLIISGFLMSAGIIVPGVSSTLILMLLGIYDFYLDAISSIYLPFLIPLGIGLFSGSLIFMKLTQFLLKKFYPQTYALHWYVQQQFS